MVSRGPTISSHWPRISSFPQEDQPYASTHVGITQDSKAIGMHTLYTYCIYVFADQLSRLWSSFSEVQTLQVDISGATYMQL